MEIYKVIFMCSKNNAILWHHTKICSSYDKAKNLVDSSVKSNMILNQKATVDFEYGKNSKLNIHFIPPGFMDNDILYGVRLNEHDVVCEKNVYDIDRFVVKDMIDSM